MKTRPGLPTRIREIRAERFGDQDDGVAKLAGAMIIPPRTWMNYEAGVTMPAEVLLKFIELTGVQPHWLLTGRGERYAMRAKSRFRLDD